MNDISDKYTTAEKVQKDPTESSKIQLSNDAYAISEFISLLINKTENLAKELQRLK